MQFKVPQFLDIEDRIFGPFTFRQFIYLVGGAGLCFVFFRLLGFFWGFIPIAAVAAFAAALAFYKPNNKPFINMVEAAIKYAFQEKLYVWEKPKRKLGTLEKENEEIKNNLMQNNGRLSLGKLRDLSWSLDVLDLKKEPKGKIPL